MAAFQLAGLPVESFAPLFVLGDEALAHRGVHRVVADSHPGFPCRVSLMDAAIGEELYLFSFEHQPAHSPYRGSGPIFVRRDAAQRILAPGEVPDYVRSRIISLRAYGTRHMMIDASVRDGEAVAAEIERMLDNPGVDYIHLHNAKRGCFSCVARRVR